MSCTLIPPAQAGPIRALAAFGGGRRILVFSEDSEGVVLERVSNTLSQEPHLGAIPGESAPSASYVRRCSVPVADAVSDILLADLEVTVLPPSIVHRVKGLVGPVGHQRMEHRI